MLMHTPPPFAFNPAGLSRGQITRMYEMHRKWTTQDARLAAEPRPVIKRCGCCRAEYTTETWPTCNYRGVMSDDGAGRIELRNCSCGSTMGLALPEVAP